MSRIYRSYPRGAGCADVSSHQSPIVAVDIEWTMMNGSRAQRRRLQRHLRREAAKSQSRQDGKP
jgi:hypothetical protein